MTKITSKIAQQLRNTREAMLGETAQSTAQSPRQKSRKMGTTRPRTKTPNAGVRVIAKRTKDNRAIKKQKQKKHKGTASSGRYLKVSRPAAVSRVHRRSRVARSHAIRKSNVGDGRSHALQMESKRGWWPPNPSRSVASWGGSPGPRIWDLGNHLPPLRMYVEDPE